MQNKMPQAPKKNPIVDEYKGLKSEQVTVVLTDKDGKQTQIKL
jgi:hypothetical protein